MRCSSFGFSNRNRKLPRHAALFPPAVLAALLASALALTPALSFAQSAAQPGAASPPAGEAPSDAPAATTAPAAEQPTAVSPEANPLPDLTAVPTLVPMPKDPPEAQEVMVPAKPAAVVSGESSWDDSIVTLGNAIKKIQAALDKAGKKPAGRPIAVFTRSSDDGFSFDAMIPIAEAPAADQPALDDGVRYGSVPPGKALRFIHHDPYELISMTYEGAALYLETRNLVGKDELIEEYVTDITDQSDKNTVVNIYVELKE